MPDLTPSDAAPGLLLGEDVEIGEGVEIGAYVIVHAGTTIGDGCVIQDGAVLGKRPIVRRGSHTPAVGPGRLRLEPGVMVGAGAKIGAGCHLGPGAMVGDDAFVRERVVLGEDGLIGHACGVGWAVTIGARSRLQNWVGLGAGTCVEEDVFVGPSVLTPNDSTMGRREPGSPPDGVTLRRGCRVGAAVVFLPGVEVGEEAVVAARSLVTRDVPPGVVVMGSPARQVREAEEPGK